MGVDASFAPGSPLYSEVVQFLYEEAEIVDASRYSDWLALFTEDIRYWMPVRTTRHLASGHGFEDVALFDDNHASLTTRVKRLETDSAWAETPPSRTRHYITNILLRAPENKDDTVLVVSNFFITRTRADHGYQLFTGRREDALRRVGGELKIAHRKILIDQTVITNTNLSILF